MVHVLYENPAWLPPLLHGLEAEGLPYTLHEVWRGVIDIGEPPQDGIWWNRMSPSSHTRGHLESVGLTAELLAWLESHGRRVINGSRAFALEVSKLRQDLALRRHGILTPRSLLAVGKAEILAAAATFKGPFITKHNQGGKGLGIQLYRGVEELSYALEQPDYDFGPRGQMLLQQYIQAPEPYITRVEVAFGRFLFAMRSATTGGFELCPSDACQAEKAPSVCPADGTATFTPSPIGEDDPLVRQYLALCAAEGIDLAGIEFVEDAEGRRYTYDINGTTNYNGAVGRELGIDGMREVARGIKGLRSC